MNFSALSIRNPIPAIMLFVLLTLAGLLSYRATAVQVSNHLRPWLPSLLALSANSPIHRGVDTGYASWRSILWSHWPSAGPPPYFSSLEEYDRTVAAMLECGSILDKAMVYWDVRPSTNFPTVEVRVSDVPATVDETVLMATVVRDEAGPAAVAAWVTGLVVAGAGIGIAWPHLAVGAMNAVADPRESGRASAAINTVQLIANAFGAALAGVLVNAGQPSDVRSARLLLFGFAAVAVLGVLAARRAVPARAHRLRSVPADSSAAEPERI